MKYKLIILLFIVSFEVFSEGGSQQVILVGPTLHYNFGKGDGHFSLGFETSYWYVFGNFAPLSADVGFEYEFISKKIRTYTEVQTGVGLGLSGGLVFEFCKGTKTLVGFQASFWAAYFGGIDLRYRTIGINRFFSPGIFAKAPFFIY